MPTLTAPLLAPYTASPLPAQSLTLITSVLGATSNWLVLRILCDALSSGSSRGGEEMEFGGPGARRGVRGVVIVSFLRAVEFWRGETRKMGLDLARLSREGRFAFVDGISEFFLPIQTCPDPVPGSSVSSSSPSPVRVPPHAVLPPRGPTSISPPTVTSQQKNGDIASRKLRWSGTGNGALDALEQEIVSAINDLRSD
ncbi:hypothetical protein I7I51_01167, partial [Histoplasma capsulatum]